MPLEKACSHLAADGRYRELCEELVAKYPNLRHKDFKHAKLTSSLDARAYSSFRFVSVDFSSGAARVDTVLVSLADVQQHLQAPAQATTSRCLYLVEGQSPELFALLGLELKVDPQVFMRHQRTALYDSEQEGGNTPCLASLVNPSSSYVLEVYEARHFSGVFQNGSLECADSLRHVALPGKDGRFEDIAVICNKASFWGRPMEKNGWQGLSLMIVDPPPTTFMQASTSGMILQTLQNTPYQGGYADFIPYSNLDAMRVKPAPPRTSTFDDLCHYFSNHSDLLTVDSAPSSVDLFLRKIVASQYMLLNQYCGGLLSHLEWRMSRQDSLDALTVAWLQEQWNVIQLFHRRVEDYSHAIKSIVRCLQLSHATAASNDWTSSKADFEDIRAKFDELLRKSESLIASFSGLSGIISSRESLAEGETVGQLTILGMVFLPLSFVTGLFSMSDKYLPGARSFGIYWAVSIPMVLVILMIPYTMVQARRLRKKALEKAHKSEYRYWENKPSSHTSGSRSYGWQSSSKTRLTQGAGLP